MSTRPQRPVTVVGAGYVGLVTAVGLARLGHVVQLVETGPTRLESLRAGRIPIHEEGLQEAFDKAVGDGRLTVGPAMPDEPGIILVCVGTPIGDDGTSDLRQLDAAMAALRERIGPDDILVIRSTLPVGGTRPTIEAAGLPIARVFTNPEFLRQGTAVEDFGHPSRVVVGRFPDADPDALAAVIALYEGIDAPRLVVDVEAAEIIKNGANAFLALKLSFTNEIASLCEEAGADVDEVLAGIGADPRIGRHIHAPELRFRRELPPEGAHDAGRRRTDVRPADARHDRRVGGQPRRPGPLRRPRAGRRRRRDADDDRPARPGLQGRHRRHPGFTGDAPCCTIAR